MSLKKIQASNSCSTETGSRGDIHAVEYTECHRRLSPCRSVLAVTNRSAHVASHLLHAGFLVFTYSTTRADGTRGVFILLKRTECRHIFATQRFSPDYSSYAVWFRKTRVAFFGFVSREFSNDPNENPRCRPQSSMLLTTQ